MSDTSFYKPCHACGDPVCPSSDGKYRSFGGKPACSECFAELEYGEIRNQNINFYGGRCVPEVDSSPWQANAIRAMEDNGE